MTELTKILGKVTIMQLTFKTFKENLRKKLNEKFKKILRRTYDELTKKL